MSTFAVVSKQEALSEPYPYVYVNDDGSVRELHPAERKYLETAFEGADGARPYTKRSYESRNGWGSIAGYCHRSKIPSAVTVTPAPQEDPNPPMTAEQYMVWLAQRTGCTPVRRPDGTIVLEGRPGSEHP